MEIVVWQDTLQETVSGVGHGIGACGGLRLGLRMALLGRATEGLVGFPIRLLAVSVAVPLILAFGATLEGDVRWSLVAFGTGLLSGTHG